MFWTILFAIFGATFILAYPAQVTEYDSPDIFPFNEYLADWGDEPQQLTDDLLPEKVTLEGLSATLVLPSDLTLDSNALGTFTASATHNSESPSILIYSSTLSEAHLGVIALSYSASPTWPASTFSQSHSLPITTTTTRTPNGLAITNSLEASPISTSTVSTVSSIVTSFPTAESHNTGDTASRESSSHRAPIIVGSVLLGLLAFSLITCVLLNTRRLRRGLFAHRVHRDLNARIVKDLENSDPLPIDFHLAQGTVIGRLPSSLPAWLKLPSQISPFHTHRDSLLSYFRTGRDSFSSKESRSQAQVYTKDKILDIVHPKSRFSITSSDYTHSIRSIDFNVRLEAPTSRKSVPLLSPEEFFSLPSSTLLAPRHSRTGSAPVFGRHRREAGLSLALSRARQMEQEEKRSLKSRARSVMAVCPPDLGLHRRRTQSVSVVHNGEWL